MKKSELITLLILMKNETHCNSTVEWIEQFEFTEKSVSAVLENMRKNSNEIQ